MSSTATFTAFDPGSDGHMSRELLEQLDNAPTSREHWKIMFISGMGFFTDAYDLFVIGVVALRHLGGEHFRPHGPPNPERAPLTVLVARVGPLGVTRVTLSERSGNGGIFAKAACMT